jgi:hypothetical protein
MKLTLRDLLGSIVRTAVPAGVGVALAWLATRYGVVLDDSTSAAVVGGAGALAGSGYYALVRVAEARWRWVGWLLGWNVAPTYRRLATGGLISKSTLPPGRGETTGPLDPKY